MKQKLLLLILPVLFFTVNLQAQIDVWDFGAEDLSALGFTNKIISDNAVVEPILYANGTVFSSGEKSSSNVVQSFSFGKVGWVVSGKADRFRTNNLSLTRYDEGLGTPPVYAVTPTYIGSIFANGIGKVGERYLSLSLVAGEEFTILVSSASTSNSTNATYTFVTPGAAINTIVVPVNTVEEIHITADVAGEYKLYDSTSKMSVYRVYGGNVTNALLGLKDNVSPVSTNVKAVGNKIYVSNVKSSTDVNIYSITGALVKSFKTNSDMDFTFKSGLYIATVKTAEGQKSVKLVMK